MRLFNLTITHVDGTSLTLSCEDEKALRRHGSYVMINCPSYISAELSDPDSGVVARISEPELFWKAP